ncbi:hypothetical protein GGR32_000011 [Mesonia hippocampi]|uniref:Hydrolase n=1 Tax=Mesonia hippocampi TaxID=1628250 RepID=A0A840EH32_9FLAO|nr:hypothetical protein [Mesonia hippocampi]MBB4117739.1 hypothetical protein [Mesonia hippocampi]
MRKHIFLYLFLFAVLYIVFQYTNASKGLERQSKKIEKLKEQVNDLETEKAALQLKIEDMSGFSLATNDKARAFYEDLGYNITAIEKTIESKIIGNNKIDADNALIPYTGMEGHIRVNRIKVLNHKWVLVEFTDSVYWGEAIIAYVFDKEGKLALDTKEAFLYPR